MRRTNRMVLGLVAVFVLGSSLVLFGCGGDDDEDQFTTIDANSSNAALLGGKSFVFADGTPLVGTATQTVLTFNNSATRFNLATGTSFATGAVTFSSINLIIGNSTSPTQTVAGSNFPPASPAAAGRTITLSTTYDNTIGSITVTTGLVTATSGPGIPAVPLNNGSFGSTS